uniref:Uncharacterized protein n=1 Tax=Sphaerodactylus townsendi TaxID=933632 RepID=A0ACB8FFD1_9SAUR
MENPWGHWLQSGRRQQSEHRQQSGLGRDRTHGKKACLLLAKFLELETPQRSSENRVSKLNKPRSAIKNARYQFQGGGTPFGKPHATGSQSSQKEMMTLPKHQV